ncbi:MAG: ATP-binding protein [Candidatus Acidiferrales bacterium]
MIKLSRPTILIACAWVFFIGGYAAAALLLPHGKAQATAAMLFECLALLFANTCLLWNSASPYRRRNAFWMLLALGCTIRLAGQLARMSHESVWSRPGNDPAWVDLLIFIHIVPFMAAAALAPHARKMRETLRYGRIDLLLLAFLWVYIFVFVAMPWKVAWFNPALSFQRNFEAFLVEDMAAVAAFGFLFFRARGSWRIVYGHLFGALALYTCGSVVAHSAVLAGQTHAGSLYALPRLGMIMWVGTAGIVARGLSQEPDAPRNLAPRDAQFPARLAMLLVLSLPVVAAWSVFASNAPAPVRVFRLWVTLAALFIGTGLVFFRLHLVDQERMELVRGLSGSLENVKRLQSQFVQSEKLASLGQLAAGAAHEINNPLTAIFGYADLLIEEHPAKTRPHVLGEKIQQQARRTRDLVTNLLSFARQVPTEKQLLDLKAVLAAALQLRNLDLREKNIRIEFDRETVLPGVRGDPNQLLQVFHHLIRNAVDAMDTAGGVLTIRALREGGNVVVEFSDTGPGMKEPEKVFDPFYTTKPLGKGTGLGLSICYGILQEHGGRITAFNRVEGGAMFRLELPAVLAFFPQASALPTASGVPQ